MTKKKVNEMGLAVAKDVLENLHLYGFKTGVYVSPATCPLVNREPEACIQSQIGVIRETCEVCALGGMLLSFIQLYNKVQVQDLFVGSSGFERIDYHKAMNLIKTRLSEAFSREQMILIEQAFEGRVTASIFGEDLEERERAVSFFDRDGLGKDEEALAVKAIMENVVENQGYFVP